MTSAVNMTINQIVEPRISEIFDLQSLKKYACVKNQHLSEWYLECVGCKSKDICKAGKQAVFILNNVTQPESSKEAKKPEAPLNPVAAKKRADIERLFSEKDPVLTLLKASSGTAKSQSIYSKVYVWGKHYPDLEKKYRMLDKFRFLWSKPYDRMTVSEILDTFYSDKKEESGENKMEKAVSAKPEKDDAISLEDFLEENAEAEKPAPERKPADLFLFEAPKESKTASPDSGEMLRMNDILTKLEKDRKEVEQKLSEINKQIDAIHTVQKLMG